MHADSAAELLAGPEQLRDVASVVHAHVYCYAYTTSNHLVQNKYCDVVLACEGMRRCTGGANLGAPTPPSRPFSLLAIIHLWPVT